MPKIVRWYLKTALVYFITALLLNIALSVQNFLPAGLWPVYLHLLVVGWISQLIIGVAIWMFPKYTQAEPRGKEWVNWSIYALLNAGLLLRAGMEPLIALDPARLWQILLVISALLQWVAGLLFAVTTWQRVKEK